MMKASVSILISLVSVALSAVGPRDPQTTSCISTLVLDPITVTRCDVGTSTYAPPPTPPAVKVYTTAFQQFCPTGLEYKTYTITCGSPDCHGKSGEIPPGFTASPSTCYVCGPEPITAIITYPVPTGPATTPGPGQNKSECVDCVPPAPTFVVASAAKLSSLGLGGIAVFYLLAGVLA